MRVVLLLYDDQSLVVHVLSHDLFSTVSAEMLTRIPEELTSISEIV